MPLHLQVLTPTGPVLDTNTEMVTAPGVRGELGILEGHLPLLSALQAGVLSYTNQDATRKFIAIGSGFVEIGAENKVLVLTDKHALPEKIDKEEAASEMREAQEALAKWSEPIEKMDPETNLWEENEDYKAIRDKVAWAQARIDTVISAELK